MAVIVVDFGKAIPGESTLRNKYKDMADALAIRESLEVPTPQASGRTNAARTVGQAKHSDIELIRYKDRASAKLAQACAAGEAIASVKIHLFRALEKGPAVYMVYELEDVFVSRIEHDTMDGNGLVFQPHFVAASETNPPPSAGLASVLSGLSRTQVGAIRTASRPAVGTTRGAAGAREIERVWLQPAKVRWVFTPYVDGKGMGSVSKGWNIQQAQEL